MSKDRTEAQGTVVAKQVTKGVHRSATTVPGSTAPTHCHLGRSAGDKAAAVPQLLSLEVPLYPLSSRPERSVVERSAVQRLFLGNVFSQNRFGCTPGTHPGSRGASIDAGFLELLLRWSGFGPVRRPGTTWYWSVCRCWYFAATDGNWRSGDARREAHIPRHGQI
jgi:hypothetical protein